MSDTTLLPGTRYRNRYHELADPERVRVIRALPPRHRRRIFPDIFRLYNYRSDPERLASIHQAQAFQEENRDLAKQIIRQVIQSYRKQKYSSQPVTEKEINWLRRKIFKCLNPFTERQLQVVGLEFVKEWFHYLVSNEKPPEEFLNTIEQNDGSTDKFHFSKGDFNELRGSIVAKHLENIPYGPVHGFIRSKYTDEKDEAGIDFFLIVKHQGNNYAIPIQAKSSDSGVEGFYNYYYYIPAINISNFKISELSRIFSRIIADRLRRVGREDSPRIIPYSALDLEKNELRKFLLSSYRKDAYAHREIEKLKKIS